MKAIKIIIQIIAILSIIALYWTPFLFFVDVHIKGYWYCWIIQLIFGVYMGNRIAVQLYEFGKWFDSQLK